MSQWISWSNFPSIAPMTGGSSSVGFRSGLPRACPTSEAYYFVRSEFEAVPGGSATRTTERRSGRGPSSSGSARGLCTTRSESPAAGSVSLGGLSPRRRGQPFRHNRDRTHEYRDNSIITTMGTLHQFQRNNKATRVRGRSGKIEVADDVLVNPSKRKIVSVFGRQPSTELQVQQSQEIVEINTRAVSFYEKGEFEQASSLFQEAAAIRNKVLAETGSQTDAELANKAPPPTTSYIYQRVDFDEGMNVYDTTQAIQLDDHPAALEATLLFNAGQAKRRLNQYAQAWHYYRLALGVLLPLPDTDTCALKVSLPTGARTVHAIVIPILHNMGQLAYRKGNVDQAIELYEAALAHGQALKGEDDYSVGVTLNCLGVLYYHLSQEESERSKNFFVDALDILTRTCGEESQVVATTLNNLGRVMVQQEDFDTALQHYEHALDIRRKKLGADDIDFAATAFNAGQSLHQKGEYERALVLYREFLRVALKRLPKDHRDIAVVLSAIAQILQEKKEYEEALELYQESLRVGRAALGRYHAEVAMLLNRLGNFYFEREEFGKALKAYKEGLDIERKVLDSGHPNIIVTLSNIAEIERQKGRYGKAIKFYREAMELQKSRYGTSSAEVAGALNVIGLIHDQMGDPIRALKYMQDALVMRRIVLGDDHIEVGNTLTCLGTIFYRRNMISTALMLFTESYRIRSSHLGPNDRDSSFTLYNVGLCHQLTGNTKEAISCFKETLRVEKLVLGGSHKDISLTLFKLGEAYNADGDLENAMSCFREALRIERELQGKHDPASIARTLNEIGNIHLARSEIKEMMAAFIESARLFRLAGVSIHSVSVSPFLKLHAAGFSPAAASA